jgi:cytochrome P450
MTQWLPLPYGAFGELLRDPGKFLLRSREQFGDVFRFRIGPLPVYFLYHPRHVRRVLYEHQKNYQRGWHYDLLRCEFGANLVVSEGPHWLRQRKLAQAAFSRERLAEYAGAMVEATARMLARWREMATAAERCEIDVGREMMRVTLEIAGRTLFSRDVSDEADDVGSAFRVVSEFLHRILSRRFTTPPIWIPTPSSLRFRRAVRTLNEIVLSLVRQRRADPQDRGDLLSMLIEARDEETGESMTDDQVRSEALTFLIAGHETTATALMWTWYLLASHEEIRRRVREEALTVLGANAAPTMADAARLTFVRMAIEEAMRLYPPIWAVPRQAVRDDEIDGYRIPARSNVLLCQYVTHRHPEVWESPERFDPLRFAPERLAERPKGAYFPFLGGPHQCIGNEFAMLEMQLLVALVLREFDLELVPGQTIRPLGSITLRPDGPVRIVLRPARIPQRV